jgi:hypothetical protein
MVEFTGLTDATDYTVYLALTSQNGFSGTQLETVSFRTSQAYRPAKVRLFTSAVEASDDVKAGLAATLAIPEDHFRLTDKDPYIGMNGRRLDVNPYQRDVYYEFQLFIGHNETYSSPVSYLSTLSTKTEQLQSNIPHYSVHDLSSSISEVKYTLPEVSESSVQSGSGWTAVTVTTNVGGKVFGVALRKGIRKPTAYQIQQGLDSHSLRMDAGRFQSASVERGQAVVLNFTNLLDSVTYSIYLAAENNSPSPDLMPSYSIRQININSAAENIDSSVVFYYLNYASLLGALLSLLLV